MKKLLFPAVFALYLTACGGPVTLTYDVEFTTDNLERMADLTSSFQRVLERRLARLEGSLLDYGVEYDKETKETRISFAVDNAKAAEQLDLELTTPFNFEVRYLVTDEPQEGDIAVEGTGNFRTTGVRNGDVDWVLGETDNEVLHTGKIRIGFKTESIDKMKRIFEEQNGNTIGLFVRERLMASMQVLDIQFAQVVEIPGVPSDELAMIFADDMNVGIHMIFHPVKP